MVYFILLFISCFLFFQQNLYAQSLNDYSALFSNNVGIGTISSHFPLLVRNSNGFSAGTGGTITTYTSGGTTYKVHTFTSSGTFGAPSPATSIDYLIVGGGGGGGTNSGVIAGGGGSGGVLAGTYSASATESLTVTVGATASADTAGNNSSLGSSLIAIGGGKGATGNQDGSNGGSGGGGGNTGSSGRTGGTATSGQGSNGGSGGGSGGNVAGGGGGGCGVTGGSSPGLGIGGAGGDGCVSTITGTSVYYAGGGAGYGPSMAGLNVPGGLGGGGSMPNVGSNNGATNSGGGGAVNGTGGSGIIIIRYIVPDAPITAIFNGAIGVNDSIPTSLLGIKGTGITSLTSNFNIRNANGTDLVKILDDGNVGIGTITPGTVLDVQGTVRSTAFSQTGSNVNTFSGNIGVGTVAPDQAVHIKNGSGFATYKADGPSGGCLMFRDTNGSSWTKCKTSGGSMSCTSDSDGICD